MGQGGCYTIILQPGSLQCSAAITAVINALNNAEAVVYRQPDIRRLSAFSLIKAMLNGSF